MTGDSDWQMDCSCGAKHCRKAIAGYRHLPPEQRMAYHGFLSSWLTARPRPYVGPASLLQSPVPVAKAG